MRSLPYKKEMIEIYKKLYDKNLITGSEGNISIRWTEEEILTSISGKHKNELMTEDFLRVDMQGNASHSSKTVSTEVLLHLEYYKQRDDINAIIHAHPVNCIALMLADIQMNKPYLPEMVVSLGAVPTAKYGTPSTVEVPNSIKKFVCKTDVIMLDHHGVVAAGQSLEDALIKMETLEHVANSLIKASMLRKGKLRFLNKNEVEALIKLRKEKYKIPGRFIDDFDYTE